MKPARERQNSLTAKVDLASYVLIIKKIIIFNDQYRKYFCAEEQQKED